MLPATPATPATPGDAPVGPSSDIDFQCPELAVGQWVEYGVSDDTGTAVISVVAEEEFDGVNCLWVQIEVEDFVAQVLIDPVGIASAWVGYEGQLSEFVADPATYIREQLDASDDMAQMFMNEDNIDNAMDFISALKIIKFDNEGMVMALDLTGVPELIEPYMSDPDIFTQGFDVPESDQPDMEEFLSELDNIDFGTEELVYTVAGNSIDAWQFSMVHPEGEISFVLSSELPIIPVAYISFADTGDADNSGYIEVVGYGFDGAINKLGEPVQVLDASMFLQGMLAQAEAMSTSVE